MPTLAEMFPQFAGASPEAQQEFPPQTPEIPTAPGLAPPQAMPQISAAPDVGGSLETDLASLTAEADQMASVRRAQAESLTQHGRYAQGLKTAQDQAEQRGADLGIGERLLAITDSRTDRRLRATMFDELSEEMGIDIRTSANKRLKALLTTLAPEPLGSLHSAIGSRVNDSSQPGEVQAFAQAVLSGKMPVYQLAAEVRRSNRETAEAGRAELYQRYGRPMMAGAALPTEEVAQANTAGAPQATTLPGEMVPELSVRLGYGPAPITTREAITTRGYQGPSDPKEQAAAVASRRTSEDGRFALLNRFLKIDDLGYGDETVSPSPDIARQSDSSTITLPGGLSYRSGSSEAGGRPQNTVQYLRDKANSVNNFLSNVMSGLREAEFTLHDATGRQVFMSREGARRLAAEAAQNAPPEQRDAWYRNRAAITDQIAGLYGGMRFDLGRVLNDVRPAGLSEGEGNDYMRRVITSDSRSRRELLTQVASEMFTDTNFLGGPAFDFNRLSPQQVQYYLNHPIVQATPLHAQLQAYVAQQQQAPAPAQQPATAPGQRTEVTPPAGIAVTAPAATTTADGVSVRPVQTETIAPAQPPAQQTEAERARAEAGRREAAAQADVDVQRRTRREALEFIPEQRERFRLEGEQRLAHIRREEENHRRAGRTEERAIAREKREIEEKRQARIQAAFSQFARALASAGGGGGSSATPSLGGGDDPNAFKMTPIQRRPAPQIRISPPPPRELPSLFSRK